MQHYEQLEVWSVAHRMVLATYAATEEFPDKERFGLTSQLRRASSSVGINIAESCGAGSDAERARFLNVAFASATEVQYELRLSRDLGLLDSETHLELDAQVQRVKRMLFSLMRYLRSTKRPDSKVRRP